MDLINILKNWIIPKNNYRKNINHSLSNTIQEKITINTN